MQAVLTRRPVLATPSPFSYFAEHARRRCGSDGDGQLCAQYTGLKLHLNTRIKAADLSVGKFDEVILATGVTPRNPRIPGQDHPKVLSYIDTYLSDSLLQHLTDRRARRLTLLT